MPHYQVYGAIYRRPWREDFRPQGGNGYIRHTFPSQGTQLTDEGEIALKNGLTIDRMIIGQHLKIVRIEEPVYSANLTTWREQNESNYLAAGKELARSEPQQ